MIHYYNLPFDPYGRLNHYLLVAKRLKDIFAYRTKILLEEFGGFK
jgi:hypothetical protein